MHVERTAQVDVDQGVPFFRLGVGEILEAVPTGVVHQDVDRLGPQRLPRVLVFRNIENQGLTVHLTRHPLGGLAVSVGDQDFRVFGEAATDRRADRAAATGDQNGLHLDRLSITRFALPMERSTAPILTSALTPMYDLMACCRPVHAAASPSTITVMWSSGPSLVSSST